MTKTGNSPGFDLSMDGINRFRQSLPLDLRKMLPLTGISPGDDFLKIARADNLPATERLSLLMDNRFSLARQNMGPIRSAMMLIWTRQNAPEQISTLMKEASFRQPATYIIQSKAPQKFQQMLNRNKEFLMDMTKALEASIDQPYIPHDIEPARKTPVARPQTPSSSPSPAAPSNDQSFQSSF